MPVNEAKLAKIQQQSKDARLGGKVCFHMIYIQQIHPSCVLGYPKKKEEGCP